MKLDRAPFATGGPGLTALFWVTFAIFTIALWLSPVLPFGDYNYHLALGAILRRMATPGSVEAQLYESNLVSYNGGFQIAVAGLSFIMPAPYAGLVVFTGFWAGFCLATIALLRALDLPPSRAFIVFPLFLGFPVMYGFINHCMALALQLYVLARVIRRPRGASVPWRYDLITAALTLVGMLSHLLASAVVYVLIFVALVVRTMADRSSAFFAYLRTLREGLVFVPTLAITAAIYRYQQRFTSRYPEMYVDNYAVDKVKAFVNHTCDLFADESDRTRLVWALAIVALCALFRARPRREPYPTMKAWLLFAMVMMWLLMPAYNWRVAVLYHRLPMTVVLFLVLAVPRATKLAENVVGAGLAVVGLACAIAFVNFRRVQLPDLRSLTSVLDAAPPGRSITIDAPYIQIKGQSQAWGGQLSAYYIAARRGVESSVTYANIPSNPVHYRTGKTPATASDAVAQGSEHYSPNAAYARHFDLVLVRTQEANPAPRLWGTRAGSVQLLAHSGYWWLYDARPYFAEGAR